MTDAATDASRGQYVAVNGLDLWTYDDGDADAETVVLIAGTGMPGFVWAPEFIAALMDAGYRVLRFDHRDCGRSTWLDVGSVYSIADLAADVSGLLDVSGVDAAHLLGFSMGGTVAQQLALDQPSRVRSLTLLSTTPGLADERLPGPAEEFIDSVVRRNLAGPPDDVEGRAAWLVDLAELMASPRHPVDRKRQLELARFDVANGWRLDSGHGVAIHESPSVLDRLGEITAPTLVAHGTEDPVVRPEHGEAVALGIDGSVYVEVPGLGHFWPDAVLADLAPILIHHIESAVHFGRS